jgi:hypothetical protein
MHAEADRPLGEEMIAERWYPTGGDSILWCHPPSRRCVTVEGPTRWDSCSLIPAVPEAPADGSTEGYLVKCYRADKHGEPIDLEGQLFWIESCGMALRHARRIRLEILARAPKPQPGVQLTLDDVPRNHNHHG